MESVEKTFRNFAPLFKTYNLQIRDIQGMHCSLMLRLSASQTCSVRLKSADHSGLSISCSVFVSSKYPRNHTVEMRHYDTLKEMNR